MNRFAFFVSHKRFDSQRVLKILGKNREIRLKLLQINAIYSGLQEFLQWHINENTCLGVEEKAKKNILRFFFDIY